MPSKGPPVKHKPRWWLRPTVSCKYCGEGGLRWGNLPRYRAKYKGQFALFDDEGRRHVCVP